MTTLVILAIGLAVAAFATWLSLSRSHRDPIDPEVEKHWLVDKLAHRPRLARFISERLDRTTAGGLLLTVGFVIVFVLALVAGAVFDMVDNASGFAEFDESVAQWGAQNATDMSTTVLNFITDLGGTTFIVVLTAAVAAWGWWRYRNWHVALFVISVAAGQALVNNGLKLIVDRSRPDISQLAGWAGSSFPSGHSAAAAGVYAAVALVLSLGASRRMRAVYAGGAFFIAAAVGATRALLGVHWLTDVIAGLAVGWACFVVAAVAFGGRFMKLGEPLDEVAHVAPRVAAESVH